IASKAEILANRERSLGFDLRSSGEIGSKLTDIPVAPVGLRAHRHRAYCRATRDHRRQAQIHIAGYGRNRQLLENATRDHDPVSDWHDRGSLFFAGGFVRPPIELLAIGADLETRLFAVIDESPAIHHIRIVRWPLLHSEFARIEATAVCLELSRYAHATEKRRFHRRFLILACLCNHIGRTERKVTGIVEPTVGYSYVTIGFKRSRDCVR